MASPHVIERRLRRIARPGKLRARKAADRSREVTRTVRESAYAVAAARSAGPPWLVTQSSLALAWFRNERNFGDEISPLVVQSLTGLRPLWVRPDYAGKVIAVGSVLTYVRPHDVVIGAGLIRASRITLPDTVDVRAVRGPLTAECAGIDPDGVAYGDPGLLAAECLGIEAATSPTWDVVLVPHLVDYESALQLAEQVPGNSRLTVVDVRRGPRAVIETIAAGRSCVSSSLHGLVVAESLGVPAIWTSISDRVTGGTFKFHDYLAGTGRPEAPPLAPRDAVEQALSGEASPFTPDSTGIRAAIQGLASGH